MKCNENSRAIMLIIHPKLGSFTRTNMVQAKEYVLLKEETYC